MLDPKSYVINQQVSEWHLKLCTSLFLFQILDFLDLLAL